MRDRALMPFYAGTRIAETVALDVNDVRRSARKGVLRGLGKGQRQPEIPVHPKLHEALSEWLEGRGDWERVWSPIRALTTRGTIH